MRFCGPGGLDDESHICTDAWKGSFDVRADRAVESVRLSVTFLKDSVECARAYAGPYSLSADTVTTMTASRVWLTYVTDEDVPRLVQRCATPASTSVMVVEVWKNNDSVTPIGQGTFSRLYTFDF